MAPVLRQIYDQMMEPKWVISMGVCASPAACSTTTPSCRASTRSCPVDVYAPGCPPGARDADPRHRHAARADRGRRAHAPARPTGAGADIHVDARSGAGRRRSPVAARDAVTDDRRDRRRATDDAATTAPSPSRCTACPVTRQPRPAGAAPDARAATSTLVKRARATTATRMCVDVTGVDYLAHPGRDAARRRRRPSASRSSSTCLARRARAAHPRCGCRCPADDPTLPSLFDLHPGTEAMEREVFDMFGIRFDGPPRPHPHPDARGLGRPPAAQGLRRSAASPCSSRRPTLDDRDRRRADRRHDPRRPPRAPRSCKPRSELDRAPSCCARSAAVLRMSEAEAADARRRAERPRRRRDDDHQHGAAAPVAPTACCGSCSSSQGETVLRCKPIIGYLHTGMEKTGEDLTYLQGGTNVTRMDYASARSSTSWCSRWPPRSCSASTVTSPSGPCGSACCMCELNRMASPPAVPGHQRHGPRRRRR